MTTGFIFTCVFCRDMKALICSGNGTSFNSKGKESEKLAWRGPAPVAVVFGVGGWP